MDTTMIPGYGEPGEAVWADWHADWEAIKRHLPGMARTLEILRDHVLDEPDDCELCRAVVEAREGPQATGARDTTR